MIYGCALMGDLSGRDGWRMAFDCSDQGLAGIIKGWHHILAGLQAFLLI